MTLTPLHARPASRPAQRTTHTTRPARAGSGPAHWTLTVEVTISGDGPDPQTRELLQDLRRLAERSDAARRDRAAVSVAADLTRAHDEARTLLHIDPAARTVRQGDRLLALSRLEFDLLLFLAEHPGQVFTRDDLLARVWGCRRDVARTVDVHIRRLRVKSGEVSLVTTVRSVGYRLADDAHVIVVGA